MFLNRSIVGFSLYLLAALSACSVATSAVEEVPSANGEVVPELTLNLSSQAQKNCDCGSAQKATLLDRGIRALVDGDHIEAIKQIQRHRRLESSPVAEWEADIAIAYDSMLPKSPFYDPQAAAKSFQELKGKRPKGAKIHPEILLMRTALSTFVSMTKQIDELQSDKNNMSENLKKREEALRRLRELALGQKEAAP